MKITRSRKSRDTVPLKTRVFVHTSIDTLAWKLVPFSLFTYPVINIKIYHNLFFSRTFYNKQMKVWSGCCLLVSGWPGSLLVTAATIVTIFFFYDVSDLVPVTLSPFVFVVAHTREWCFQIVTVRVVSERHHNRKEGQNDQRCTSATRGRETPWTTRYIERNYGTLSLLKQRCNDTTDGLGFLEGAFSVCADGFHIWWIPVAFLLCH